MSKPLFNPQTANAVELAQLLGHGQLTSVQIVEAYLAQIDLHNPGLNALISRSPREMVLRAAERLDQERSNGKLRGPLHGIPIILKVSLPLVMTHRACALMETCRTASRRPRIWA